MMFKLLNRAVNRRCICPTQIKGIDIASESVVAVDVLTLHNDPEYWNKPEEFNPLRFAPENKINPLVYMPFGIGPRICIGMRFALLEIKITLAKILSKYDILPSLHTPREIVFAEGVVRRPRDGIPITIKRRIN
jgi:cytochrome P450